MGTLFTIQPEDREPIEFTHFDCWEDGETWGEISRAWSATLGTTLPEDNQDSIILELLRQGFDIYEGDNFIEIYESKEVKNEL